jgi:4-amino-4-deoxy-L-arabinose transferase-like glycosyltransferase
MTHRDRARFARALGLILFAALALRITYVVTVTRHDHDFYDATYYEAEARSIADGRGFTDPFAVFHHQHPGPSALHPPLTALVLVPAAWLSDDPIVMRFEMALLGVGLVAAIALLGRAIADDRVGLVAGGIAAVYPNLWMSDGLIMSETLAMLLTALALLLVYRIAARPSLGRVAALGVVCGLATLTRAELVLYLPLLALPVVWLALRGRRRQLLTAGAVAVLATVVVVGPWVGYNLARFEEPVFVSTNDGLALLGASCSDGYYGSHIGLWSLRCRGRVPAGDESQQSHVYRDRAFDYIRDHLGRLPVVTVARVGRLWSVWNPVDTVRYNEGEGRPAWASVAGVVALAALLVAAVAGVIGLHRRRVPVWPLLVPIGIVTLSAVLFYGQPRLRAPAEPSIVVLAAFGIVAWLDGRRRSEASTADHDAATSMAATPAG